MELKGAISTEGVREWGANSAVEQLPELAPHGGEGKSMQFAEKERGRGIQGEERETNACS